MAETLVKGCKRGLVCALALCFLALCFPTAAMAASSYDKADAESVFDMHNDARAKKGLAPLAWNESLYSAAQTRAQEASKSFSHVRPDGRDFRTVHRDAHGENLVYSTNTSTASSQLFKLWMESGVHKENILLSRYKSIAVASYTTGNRKVLVALFSTSRAGGDAQLASVSLNMSAKVFPKAQGSVRLKLSTAPAKAPTGSLLWSSSNAQVARVDKDGRVQAVGKGSCTVTVKTEQGKTAKCTILVGGKSVSRVAFTTKSKVTLQQGKSTTLKAKVLPKDATNKTLLWTSSDPAVATVSKTGKVKAVGAGNCKITARAADGGKAKTCTIFVV